MEATGGADDHLIPVFTRRGVASRLTATKLALKNFVPALDTPGTVR
jgi:hypothetical protein